jgi:hypothetical protein
MIRPLLLIFLLNGICLSCRSQETSEPQNTKETREAEDTTKSEDSVQTYQALLKTISAKREEFKNAFTIADPSEKDSIVKSAREYIYTTITKDIFSYWYGTPWEFYGMTRTPREGTIACGYFVTGVLTDAGFNIPRIAWAQCASETFIKKLGTTVHRYSNKDIVYFERQIKEMGYGLYVVGLDSHVGFISNDSTGTKFVHSGYYKPEIGVVAEELAGYNPLNDSRYRVIVKLFEKQ